MAKTKMVARSRRDIKKNYDIEKGPDYYFVKEIINHRSVSQDGSQEGLEYLIRWEDYDPKYDTWEPERHLDGSVPLLMEYKEKNKLGEVLVKTRVGYVATKAGDFNDKAWATLDEVIERLNKQRKFYNYSPNLPLEVVHDKLSVGGDRLVVVPIGNHCYMGIFIATENICYIADGMDSLSTPQVRTELQSLMVGIKIQELKFPHQRRIDHCGASACIIGLELARIYGSDPSLSFIKATIEKEGTFTLFSPRNIRERNETKLHKGPSKKAKEGFILKRHFNKCPFCGWTTKTRSRLALSNHMRVHIGQTS